jgi:hypothetical protein
VAGTPAVDPRWAQLQWDELRRDAQRLQPRVVVVEVDAEE